MVIVFGKMWGCFFLCHPFVYGGSSNGGTGFGYKVVGAYLWEDMAKYLLIILFFSSCAGSSRIYSKKERRENVIGVAFAAIVITLVAGRYGKSVSP